MKRALLIVLVTAIIAALPALAPAAETTFSGEYQIRAFSEWNFDKVAGYPASDKKAQYDGWFDQRFRLTITHTRSEFLKAVIRLDLAEDTWGQGRAFRMNNLADGSYLDQAYLEFKVDPVGKFRVGKMPVSFGQKLMFARSAAALEGIEWSNKWGPVAASLLYSKLRDRVSDGSTTRDYNWDANLFALDLKYTPTSKHIIEVYGGVLDSNYGWPTGSWYARRLNDAILSGTKANLDYVGYTVGFAGVAYTGNIADMIDLKAEYGAVFGSMSVNDNIRPVLNGTFVNDPSISGWSLYLDAAYYNDMVRVGLAFLMTSGEKHYWGSGSTVNHINMPVIFQEGFGWGTIIGNEVPGDSHSYDNRPLSGPLFGRADMPIENITSVKLYASIMPIEKLTINAAVIWAKWTDPVGTGTSEFCAYPHPANWYGNYRNLVSPSASADLGWEFDLGFSYEIIEGLTYTCKAGVLLTGDSWDYLQNGVRKDWGPIWSVQNYLMYKF